MKLRGWIVLLLILAAADLLLAEPAQTFDAGARTKAAAAIAKLPLSFEAAPSGLFRAHSGNYSVSVGATESYLVLREKKSGETKLLRWSFEGANKAVVAEGNERLPGVVNYYIGKDSANWRVAVPRFARVRANDIYPGVDVIYYGDQRNLEFDFVVAPNANPAAIAFTVAGADKVFVSNEGDLVADVMGEQVHFVKPYAYQQVDGSKRPVSVGYVLDANGEVRLQLGAYERNRELIVDPILNYSTFLGGSQADTGNGVAIDSTGNAYVTGQTCSNDFIAPSPNPSGTAFAGVTGACDAYVTKLNPAGTAVIYTTFIAGQAPNPPNATASGAGIAVDVAGRAYIVGTTNFWDLPLTSPNPPTRSTAYNGGDSDAFITILNPDGTLLRETYIGGANVDQGYGIVVDSTQNVSVVGQTCSADFPAYNSIQAKTEACVGFITKLDFGLHIAPPIVTGASPLSPRAASLSDACGYGANCPATADATKTYYFFSTLFGGQPLPPTATWPRLSAPGYTTGLQVPNGAITIGTPVCAPNYPQVGPQILLATGGANVLGTAGGLSWPCGAIAQKAGVPDSGGFVWYDLGPAPAAITYATTEAYGVAIDPVGDVFAVGGTNTATLVPYLFYGGYSGINYGVTGPWIVKLNGLDGAQIYATALGSSPTQNPAQSVNAATGVAVDSSGNAYVVGTALSGILTTTGTANSAAIGGQDAFVIKLNKAASAFDYGTYLGGTGDDQGLAIAVDSGGSAYVTGSTKSNDLPVINPIADANGNAETALLGSQDAFVARLTPTGSALTMMAYLGGASSEQGNAIALDPLGDVYVAGTTQSVDFPTYPATAAQILNAGGTSDAFVAMINGSSFPQASISPSSLNFGNQSVGSPSATQTITLTNNGNGILSISNLGVVGTSGDFSQSNNCGSQLTPSGGSFDHCTITVTFTPKAAGARSDILQIVDNSANTPQIVALSGTGVVVQGVLQLSPTSLDFGNQQTSTTSAAQVVTLSNTSSTYPLSIASITVGGDFAQTNNCPTSPATLAASANCSISITFSPKAAGSQSVNLTVTGAAANSPQTITITGNGTTPGSSGTADFTLSSSVQTATVSSKGGTVNFNIYATPLNGFKQTLNFTCVGPSGASCTVSPTSLAMDGTSMPSVAVTIQVGSGNGYTFGASNRRPARPGLRPGALFASILPFGLLGITFVGKKRRVVMVVVLALVMIGCMLFTVSCGVSSGGSSGSSGITPGSYQLTITAASSGTGAMSHTITVPLTVN